MNWEPWTGCYAVSDGCTYCYYYGKYSKRHGQNTITKTDEFDKPIAKTAKGTPKISNDPSQADRKIVATCFASDFFIAEADEWRFEAWAMIRSRPDLEFLILTKRIDRFNVSLPSDWGDGYDNVNIGCTVENQEIADYRLPLFLSYPIKRHFVACSPLLGAIDLSAYIVIPLFSHCLEIRKSGITRRFRFLCTVNFKRNSYISGIEHVSVGGETGREARECDYEWVLNIREQCVKAGITFWFKNIGSFFKRDGVVQKVNPFKQNGIAKELGINILGDKKLF